MNLILLGGMSQRNKEWLLGVEKHLAPLFDETYAHQYAHWASAAPQIDLEHELSVLKTKIRGMEPYVLFAKSAGVVLSAKGIAEKVLQPHACLFTGTPLGFVRDYGHQMDEWLKHLNVPTIFVQNAHDPTGSYHELERYLRQHMSSPNYTLAEWPGETHDYDDFEELYKIASKLAA